MKCYFRIHGPNQDHYRIMLPQMPFYSYLLLTRQRHWNGILFSTFASHQTQFFMKNFLLLLLFPFFLNAQTIGSFQLSVNFPQADYNVARTLYFYVPEDYDPNQAYKILVGFRGGPNTDAGQFRDQLRPLSDSLNAIILCPENIEHFGDEEGQTKLLFQYSLDTAMAMYNIDPDFVYLTGLSFGGRHAVIVAMDTDDGPIPNLRGVIPFAAGNEADLQPNYDNIADFAPACICIGLSDAPNFINVSNALHNDIQSNGGTSILNEIPGVGHTVAFSSFPDEMMECFNFIEAQYEISDINDVSQNDKGIIVYPNPSNGVINFSFLGDEEKIEEMELIDSDGKPLKKIDLKKRNFDISEYSSGGLLFLNIKTEKRTYVKKIIIDRR